MSYDLQLEDPVTGDVLHTDEVHLVRGGTYAVGGTTELSFNVTYNYAPHFYRTMGEKGLRSLYGMTGAESLEVISKAAEQLSDDVDDNYWEPTEGNAKRALHGLLALARLRPDGVWNGD